MAREINVFFNRNSNISNGTTRPLPMPLARQMIGFWGTVTESHPENCTCHVMMPSGYEIANVRVLSRTWVTVDDDKGYLSGERYLPPKDTFVFCVCPEGNLADTVILGSGFAMSVPEHADFKTDSDDQTELDNDANTRKIVRNSGWTYETDYRNGSKKIRNKPEEGDATISVDINQGEDGEEADGGEIKIKIYDTDITITEKDDAEIKFETLGNTVFDITEDNIDITTDDEFSLEAKKAISVKTDDEFSLEAKNDIGLKSSGSGKLDIGNAVATLGAMIDDLLGYLAQLKTVGSPANHNAAPDFVANIQALKAKWGQVFK